jgi:hypothetical protein
VKEVLRVQYTRLGRTGLKVSRIGLGCMSYGNAAVGMHQWTLDEDAAAPFFRQAVELGVTFWDTANVYQGGTSEQSTSTTSTASTPKLRSTRPWRRSTAWHLTSVFASHGAFYGQRKIDILRECHNVESRGLEPRTPALQRQCSAS